MRNSKPLYVIVDAKNKAVDTAQTKQEARNKSAADGLYIKLFADHKGDKSGIGY